MRSRVVGPSVVVPPVRSLVEGSARARSRTCRARPVARSVGRSVACIPQSAERARSVHDGGVFRLSGRHDVRRHELGSRAPRDDGQHPGRGRRHHLVHVQDQQRDSTAQVAP